MERSILENISDVLLVVNQEGTIIRVNEAVKDIFLWDKKELIGQPLTVLMPERFRMGHGAMFKGYSENPAPRRMGKGSRSKFKGIDKNGNEFYIDIALSHFTDDKNETFYTALIRDISDIVNISKDLEKSIDALIESNKKLDHFAYILSHDLKAPARNIKSLLEILQESIQSQLSGEDTELFEMSVQQSDKMVSLIDGVLEYTRSSSSDDTNEQIELKSIIENVIEELAIPSTFTVTTEIHNDTVVIQKTQFSQVLSNLIGNAVKYHDKENGNITVKCFSTIDEIVCEVIDDGPGIPEKHHKHIFEMFGTAHGQTRSDSTGIGLAIVKKIIDENGGNIQVKSEVGKGSTFTFTWRFN